MGIYMYLWVNVATDPGNLKWVEYSEWNTMIPENSQGIDTVGWGLDSFSCFNT